MTVTAQVGTVSQSLVNERARAIVDDRQHPCVVLLRARPTWSGPEQYRINDRTVRIGTGLSQLDVLDQIVSRADDESLIVLTDRTESELGDTVLTRVRKQRIETVDEWDSVAELFGAHRLDPRLRRSGSWVPGAMLEHRPPNGWQPVSTGVLDADHALRHLLARVLDVDPDKIADESWLLERLDEAPVRDAWRETDEQIRTGLTYWAGQSVGTVAELALVAAAGASEVSTIALGLTLSVLWPEGDRSRVGKRAEARIRIESYFGGRALREEEARAYVLVARDLVRAADERGEGLRLRAQAEALLSDLGWSDGARGSSMLEAGFRQRLRELAATLDRAPDERETALARLREHELAALKATDVMHAQMAVRLARWLDDGSPEPTVLVDAIREHAHNGGWVRRAYETLAVGADDSDVAAAYRRLLGSVQERCRASDERFAQLLVDETRRDGPRVDRSAEGHVVPVEDLRAEIVTPLSKEEPVLLIVLDGMSMRVATELAEDTAMSWNEILPADSNRRAAAVSVVPTLTTYARTSLFAGRLAAGQQADEKRAFDGPLFHKSDLRAPAGQRLPNELNDAIEGRHPRVGVVLNTVDDALAKHDPGGTRWTLDQVQNLSALLDAAHRAGRVVVLTSDHGHVVEHGDSAKVANGEEARWRTAASGSPGDGEIAISGRRVLTGDEIILPWRDDIRYGALRAGYHGGASPAEVTVPVIVLTPVGMKAPSGWHDASPQSPIWWNQAASPRATAPAKPRKRVPEPQQEMLVEMPDQPQDADWVATLLSSEVYEHQKKNAGRMALPDEQVEAVLRVVLRQPGTPHRVDREVLAAELGVPATGLPRLLSVLKRMLNVEGYPVIEDDAASATVILDEEMLREQFELPRSAAR